MNVVDPVFKADYSIMVSVLDTKVILWTIVCVPVNVSWIVLSYEVAHYENATILTYIFSFTGRLSNENVIELDSVKLIN